MNEMFLTKKGLARVLKEYEGIENPQDVGKFINETFNGNRRLVEFRYHEKLKVLRSGQICSCCGLFYFLDEDEQIEETGICQGCQDGFDMEQEADADILMEQKRDREG
jgi:hypothetical protein